MAEHYTGVKYNLPDGALERKTVFTVENKAQIRAMKKAGKELSERGLSQGTTGNLSVRTGSKFIITATASDLSRLSDEDFVVVEGFDAESNTLTKASGLKEPSSETPMHDLVYKTRKDVNAIIHVHDRLLVSEDAIRKLKLPVTEAENAYGTKELAQAVAGLLAKGNAAVAKGHGIVVAGKSIGECTESLVTLRRRAP